MNKNLSHLEELVLEVLGDQTLCMTEIHALIHKKVGRYTPSAVSQALTSLTNKLVITWERQITRSETVKRKDKIRFYTVRGKKKPKTTNLTPLAPTQIQPSAWVESKKQPGLDYIQPSLSFHAEERKEKPVQIQQPARPKKISFKKFESIFKEAEIVSIEGEEKPLFTKQCLFQNEITLCGDRHHCLLREDSVNSILLLEETILIDLKGGDDELLVLRLYLPILPLAFNSMEIEAEKTLAKLPSVGKTEAQPAMASLGSILPTLSLIG